MSWSQSIFEAFITPLTVEDFARRHFEREPLVLAGRDPCAWNLLSTADLETLVFTLSAPENRRWFQLIKDGQPLPMRPPLVDENGDLVPTEVVTCYGQGYTVVLNQVQRRWPPVKRFCRELEESLAAATGVLLKTEITANAYMTPGHARGFSPHYDDHDVFVLQLEGSKNWRIYPALVRFPLAPQTKIAPGRLGQPLWDIHITPGDALYIPRGFPHEALTVDAHSLHLTFGIRTFTWLNLVEAAIESDESFRASVFLDRAEHDSVLGAMSRFEVLFNQFSSADALAAAARKLAGRKLANAIPDPEDHFEAIHRISSLTESTRLRKRHCAGRIDLDDGFVTLSFPGNRVRYPRGAEQVLRFLLETDDIFEVSSLPIAPSERSELVRRLVHEGFLTIVDTEEARTRSDGPHQITNPPRNA